MVLPSLSIACFVVDLFFDAITYLERPRIDKRNTTISRYSRKYFFHSYGHFLLDQTKNVSILDNTTTIQETENELGLS